MKSRFFKLPREVQYVAFLLLGFALVLSWDQSYYWRFKEDYSFGFIVPFFVVYVLYERWPRIQALFFGEPEVAEAKGEVKEAAATEAARGNVAVLPPQAKIAPTAAVSPFARSFLEGLAGIVALGSLALFALGGILRGTMGVTDHGTLLMTAGFTGLWLSLAFLVCRKDAFGAEIALSSRVRFALLFLFPAAVWIISAPMVFLFDAQVKVFLLGKVTTIVFNIFDFLGLPIQQEGNVLILPKGSVGVADACSGVRSLTACIFAGSFLSAVFLDRTWKKVLLVAMAMILAFITNVMRSLFLTGWAYANGSDSIAGNVHDITGYAVLGLTSLLLLALIPVLNFKFPTEFDFPEDHAPPEKADSP